MKKKCFDLLFKKSQPVFNYMGRLFLLLFNRLILIVSIPFVFLEVILAFVILIKNWAFNITKEIDV